MKSFNDKGGQTWNIDINVDAIKRVKADTGLDLIELSDGTAIESLIGDPVKLVDTIYVLCREQATARNVTDVEFGRAMGGDPIDHATTALLEEFVDFFPSRKRQAMTKALERIRAVEKRMIETAEAMIDDPRVDAVIEAAMKALREVPFSTAFPQPADAIQAP